ncbi:hypothetical protein [Paraurantiacibacter namhicola]|uniref:Uncharacterized protein n=1 Tax=Paraurantiacibacter namhicola TaxID=645517 RepID=A0A1C7DAV2_9SPHN|nr:hypothetical protein [Paraurantiacibacter namhicola]ANU08575.1 hypothetical protein A6F65_02292 [Paraurantiacibacter namhicola]
MKWLLTGIAALAITAAPAAAQGNGKGNGNGNGNGAAAKAERGAKPDKPRGNGQVNGNAAANGNGAAKKAPQAMRGNGAGKPDNRGPEPRAANRGNGNGNGNANGNRGGYAGQDRYDRRGPDTRTRNGDLVDYRQADYGLIDGCPPGLAKKRNGCLPPGQAKKQDYSPSWFGYDRYDGQRFAYRDGYLLRFGNGGGLLSYLPLLGGALAPGQMWPDGYRAAQVPAYYDSFYNLGGPGAYRYADNVIYRVDPETAAITSIAALLTGDDFSVGSPVPAGYDVYNVPYAYRDEYAEGPDRQYRYSDGYIYQIDPETRLVAAAIELVAS